MAAALAAYRKLVAEFLGLATPFDNGKGDIFIDGLLAMCLNERYLDSYCLNRAEKLVAGWMCLFPGDGRRGPHRVIRSWRCLGGFRKLRPQHSRDPTPWCLIMAIIEVMLALKVKTVVMFTLVSLQAYLRPCEALRLSKGHMVRPVKGMSKHWGVIIKETGPAGKCGSRDDSVTLDNPRLEFLNSHPQRMAYGDFADKVFPITYLDVLRVFKKCNEKLGTEIAPYHLKHSGASADKLSGLRSLKDMSGVQDPPPNRQIWRKLA